VTPDAAAARILSYGHLMTRVKNLSSHPKVNVADTIPAPRAAALQGIAVPCCENQFPQAYMLHSGKKDYP
jgi:hypothetical protein